MHAKPTNSSLCESVRTVEWTGLAGSEYVRYRPYHWQNAAALPRPTMNSRRCILYPSPWISDPYHSDGCRGTMARAGAMCAALRKSAGGPPPTMACAAQCPQPAKADLKCEADLTAQRLSRPRKLGPISLGAHTAWTLNGSCGVRTPGATLRLWKLRDPVDYCIGDQVRALASHRMAKVGKLDKRNSVWVILLQRSTIFRRRDYIV